MHLEKFGEIFTIYKVEFMKREFPYMSDNVIQLVPFELRHLNDNYISWLNDIEVVRYSEQRHKIHSLESCRNYFEQQQKSDNYFLAVELIDKQITHVGNVGVSVDFSNKIADLSIIIGDKSLWGTGVGSRAWSLALKAVLFDFNFRMVTAGTMEVNKSMIKLMKRSGMNIDCVLPRRFMFEGEEIGFVAASISKFNFKI